MKKLLAILMIAVLVAVSSFKEDDGDVLSFTNTSYTSTRVNLYYDYNDGYGYSLMGSIHLGSRETKFIPIDRGDLYRYAYSTNRDETIRTVISANTKIY